jgi:flagellar motor component MotA
MLIKLLLTLFSLLPSYALAYLGPGMGGGFITAILGFITAFFLIIVGILYYPIKRALKKRKHRRD